MNTYKVKDTKLDTHTVLADWWKCRDYKLMFFTADECTAMFNFANVIGFEKVTKNDEPR